MTKWTYSFYGYRYSLYPLVLTMCPTDVYAHVHLDSFLAFFNHFRNIFCIWIVIHIPCQNVPMIS